MFDTVSSKSERTRLRILRVARALLEETHGAVSMAEVAAQAGVTRQLLYLYFRGRSDLLLEVVRHVDAEIRTPALEQPIHDAEDAREALRQAVAVQGRIKPLIDGIVSAVDHARQMDPAAAAAWNEREQARFERVVHVVTRLNKDNQLSDDWSVEDAARMAWAATSQHSWQALVRDGVWSTDRWVAHTTALLEAALCPPLQEATG